MAEEKKLFQGKRLPDTVFGDLPDDIEPGTYWKYLSRYSELAMVCASDYWDTNLTRTVWGYMPPDGNGIGTLMQHTVREMGDGSISVVPGDGSSNSILHTGGAQRTTWHGYIYNGVWEEC